MTAQPRDPPVDFTEPGGTLRCLGRPKTIDWNRQLSRPDPTASRDERVRARPSVCGCYRLGQANEPLCLFWTRLKRHRAYGSGSHRYHCTTAPCSRRSGAQRRRSALINYDSLSITECTVPYQLVTARGPGGCRGTDDDRHLSPADELRSGAPVSALEGTGCHVESWGIDEHTADVSVLVSPHHDRVRGRTEGEK